MKLWAKVEVLRKPLLEGISYNLTRLMATAIFIKKNQQFSMPFEGIIDTGAPISVIPKFIWKDLNVAILGEISLKGVNRKTECGIPCYIGGVLMKFTDAIKNQSPEFSTLTYLSQNDDVPLIFGYDRCLEYFQLHTDITENEAFLIWNKKQKE